MAFGLSSFRQTQPQFSSSVVYAGAVSLEAPPPYSAKTNDHIPPAYKEWKETKKTFGLKKFNKTKESMLAISR